MDAVDGQWLTTSETARVLGVSRQHVVNLCERGDLNCAKIGTHRRIPRSEVHRLLSPQLTREQEKSLWLHRALLGHLMIDPGNVLETARENIRRWKHGQRPDGMAARYMEMWERVIDGGVDDVAIALTGTDENSRELRQNSPFAGVLPEIERGQVLRSFRQHWESEHTSA